MNLLRVTGLQGTLVQVSRAVLGHTGPLASGAGSRNLDHGGVTGHSRQGGAWAVFSARSLGGLPGTPVEPRPLGCSRLWVWGPDFTSFGTDSVARILQTRSDLAFPKVFVVLRFSNVGPHSSTLTIGKPIHSPSPQGASGASPSPTPS